MMSEPPISEGGCLCGQVRYRLEGEIGGDVAHCHCSICRRAAGSPAVTWLTLPKRNFTLTAGTPSVYRSSPHGERAFCASCGSPISFWSRERPDEIDVTVATLDHPERVAPKRHVWASARLPWLVLDPDLPSEQGETLWDQGAPPPDQG